MTTEEQIREHLIQNGIWTSDELPGKLSCFLRLLLEWNRKMDLTAVDESEELIDKHLIDSLTVLKTPLMEGCRTLIDVGTGAGFPGMALAMARPDLSVTLLDAQQKRLNFLQAVQDAAGVKNVKLLHARAEDAARQPEHREKYDIAAARALAPLNVLHEYLLPFVRIGGKALCWKGPALRKEMETGQRAAILLGGEAGTPISCPVNHRDWDHMILPVIKKTTTPSCYPRKAGTPKNKPLGS